MSTINLTSLLDLTFVLLIAFMIVAPALKHGIKIDLPKVDADSIVPKKAYSIVIKKRKTGESESNIYLNEKRVDLDEIFEKLQANYERDPEIDVLIESDKSVLWDDFAKVLGAVRKAGVRNIGLVTEPER